MSVFVRRKLVWLTVLMVWVGMVSAVVIYQATEGDIMVGIREEENILLEMKEESLKTLAARVDEDPVRDEDFFIGFRLERDRSRSQQLELLRDLIHSPEIGKELMEKSQEQILMITKRMEMEMEVESLIRARGFQDALAFIHGDSIDIIVLKHDLLSEDEVAQIADTASRVTGFPYQEITILERPLNTVTPSYP